jgi:hypothetical protein
MEHDTGSGADPAAAPDEQAGPDEPAAAPTGEPRVDAAVGRLDQLGELPVSEHPGVYERIHEELVEVLGELHPGTQGR